MDKLNEIRAQLAVYLQEKISLSEFEDWFVQSTWNIDSDRGSELRQAVHAIELRLSEFSSGHLSESNLRKELLPFVTSLTTSLTLRDIPTATALPLEVNWLPVGALRFGEPAGKESLVVFA